MKKSEAEEDKIEKEKKWVHGKKEGMWERRRENVRREKKGKL